MKTIKEKLQLWFLWRILMNLNMFFNLCWILSKKHQQAGFIKKTILNRVWLKSF